ncbi:MAG: HDIG domain-containing protein [Candidatus Azobacteroides sp.]|nr:HDIG domain-containing protein [Candidatus Azobacteroides sp.]
MKIKAIFFQNILLILSIVIIVFFLPRETKFKYQYQEGKPWKYDLLTAPFDFPIYKTPEELQQEKDSVLKDFMPYFSWMEDVPEMKKQMFNAHFRDGYGMNIPIEYFNYVNTQLDKIYAAGIITDDKYEELVNDGVKSIMVFSNNNKSKEYPLSKIYTEKTAYAQLVDKAPAPLDKFILSNLNLSNYLSENLEFDAETTAEVKEQMVSTISQSSDLIQTGEKIVDRGEVVNPQIYKVLRSLQLSFEKRTTTNAEKNLILLGQILLVSCLLVLFLVYLVLFRPEITSKKRSVFFLFLMITGFSLFPAMGLTLKYAYVIPFTILPIIIRTFFDSRTALMAYTVVILINALSVPFSFEFILIQFVAGIVSVYSLKDLTQRSQIFACAIFIFIAYSFIYFSYTLTLEGIWSKISGYTFIYFFINALLVLFTYPLIYLFEKVFGFISSVTLVELSNINNSILRKLSEVAPGTFHHSLQVSNLATEAASKIGANVQLVRTGALYHDIGKIKNPVYFTENQAKGVNPHDGLPFEESAQIIVRHVTDGIKLAEKMRLPQQVVDFIVTHHGKGKARYFYNFFKNQYPDQEVNEELFTYPGPNPFSKETALMMMADSVEAASRSLPVYNDESISELVNRIIDGQMEEGLLKNAPLSFKEIELVKQIFIQKLKTIYHTRISYPKLEKNQDMDISRLETSNAE